MLVALGEVAMRTWMSVVTRRSRIRCRRIAFPLSLFWRWAVGRDEVLSVVVVAVLEVAPVLRLLSSARLEPGIAGVGIWLVVFARACWSVLTCLGRRTQSRRYHRRYMLLLAGIGYWRWC